MALRGTGPSLHSVVSRFRFVLIGRALVFVGPLWLGVSLVVLHFQPLEQATQSSAYLLTILALTVLLTPLQGAGEEYGFRGLVFRITSSWNRGPRTALVVGVLLSSLVFSLVHISADPWFNLWTFSLAVSMAIVTWRTGGIEVACVVHGLNNTLTYVLLTVLHADLSVAVERSAGSGMVVLVVPSAAAVLIAAVVWVRTRRTGPALTPAPARYRSDGG
jgi:membrane protease YdiL (CAAX protease family)